MKKFLIALFFLAFTTGANAASRFWVGGTGTWDNATTTHWSASTGGAGGASVPAATDTVTFDGSSGGGTVTVNATINGTNTLVSITAGAFTGALDLNANTSTIVVAPAAFGLTANFLTGGLTYHTVTLGPSINTTSIATGTNGATFATLNMVGPAANIRLANCTVTNAINWAGTAAN